MSYEDKVISRFFYYMNEYCKNLNKEHPPQGIFKTSVVAGAYLDYYVMLDYDGPDRYHKLLNSCYSNLFLKAIKDMQNESN